MGPMVLTSSTFAQVFVVEVSDGLASGSAHAGIVEEEVNGLPVEFCGYRLDTRRISHIQGQDLQFAIARVYQSLQLGSGIWVTTCRVNIPAVGQILSGELEPKSAIGTGD
jgi:hypothetical protein